jgi:hypothetical protein
MTKQTPTERQHNKKNGKKKEKRENHKQLDKGKCPKEIQLQRKRHRDTKRKERQ